MIKVLFTPSDIKANRLLTPGKYGFVAEAPEVKKQKDSGQTVYWLNFKGFTGEAVDVPVRRAYTEEYKMFLQNILSKGFGIDMDEELGAEFDLDSITGRKIVLYIKRGRYNGQDQNEIEGFEPWSEDAEPVEA